MKILAIRGHNLAALQGTFEVDFETSPLAETGLFGIFGKTGAGKSTLLNAMCLALYNEIPALQGAPTTKIGLNEEDCLTQRDSRSLLSHGMAQGSAEVEFIGVDQKTYCATWSVRRAGNQPSGRLQPIQMSCIEKETGHSVLASANRTEVLSAIESKIGLNFQQFTRSVLLAQHEFNAFLKAKENERAELLETLTGLEEYSQLSKLAFERNREETARLEACAQNKNQIETLSEEERTKWEEELQNLQTEATRLEVDFLSVSQQLEWVRQQTRLEAAYQNAQRFFEEKQAAFERVEDRRQLCAKRKQYAGAQAVLAHFKTTEATYLHYCAALAVEEQRLKEVTPRVLVAQQARDTAETVLKDALAAKDAAQPQLVHARALADSLGRVQAEWNRLDQQRQAHQARRRQLEHNREAALNTQEAALLHQKNLEKQLKSLEARLAEWSLSVDLEGLEAQQRELTQEKEQIQQALSDWKASNSQTVQGLRVHLMPDQPCPVCGSAGHPYAEQGGALLEEKQKAAEAFTAQLKRVEKTLKDLDAQKKTALAQLKEKETFQKQQIDLIAKCSEAALSTQKAENSYQESVRQLQDSQDEAKRLEEACSVSHTELQRLEHACAALFEGEAVERVEVRLNGHVAEAQSTLQACEAELARVNLIQQTAHEACLVMQARKESAFEEKQKAEGAFSELGVDPRALEALFEGVDAQALRAEERALAVFYEDKLDAESRLKVAQEHLNAHQSDTPPKASLQTLEQYSIQLEQARKETHRRHIQAESALKADQEKSCLKAEAEAAWAKQKEKAQVWQHLNQLIGSGDGKKFRNYAQRLSLSILIEYSNLHLAQLNKRYRLEVIPDSLGLQIVDQDMGNEVRSTHLLSGGESFLVSLALALGLASLSSHRVQVESLFIDEGFGTLDADTLAVAMNALDALQAQGRKVGLISHVESLKEHLAVKILVRSQQGGRSTLKVTQRAGA